MNLLKEFLEKLEFFQIKGKKVNLLQMNHRIDNALETIVLKKKIISDKIRVVSQKISKVCLTQNDFKENYLKFNEKLLNEMKENINIMKNTIKDLSNKFNLLNFQSKKLIFIRNKFNSEYIDEDNKKKLISFTEDFLNFHKTVNKVKDLVIN